jgi:hypothetical protein
MLRTALATPANAKQARIKVETEHLLLDLVAFRKGVVGVGS